LKELFRFRTGLDVRVGYPGEHLAGESENINEPCYATGVGLLIKGFEFMDEHAKEIFDGNTSENLKSQPIVEIGCPGTEHVAEVEKKPKKIRKPPFSIKGVAGRFKANVVRYFDVEPDSSMDDQVRETEKEAVHAE